MFVFRSTVNAWLTEIAALQKANKGLMDLCDHHKRTKDHFYKQYHGEREKRTILEAEVEQLKAALVKKTQELDKLVFKIHDF